MRFGADYYPEHWPEDRWETDAKLMQEAGFNTVRMAEFAWVKMEPEKGTYQFDWLLKSLDILNKHGIQTVIGTPTATPPAWLCTEHPEILRVDEWQRQVQFGNRQQSCINQPAYREASYRIVEKMADTFGSHDGVIAWQIDNEFGPLCYCETCREDFQEWLKVRYGTLEALEEAWGTIFWSQTYTDWAQIPLPWHTSNAPNPSLALDYRRFFSDCYADFQKNQIDIIRKKSDKPITHNFMGAWPEVLNYQQLADQLDFVVWDNYPFGSADPASISCSHDIIRGYKRKGYWVMEQMSGPGGWGEMAPSPKPGRIREWTYHGLGHGADAMVYFRWRVCRYGTEQYWHGILNHDGSTNRRYQEIKRTREEILKIEDKLIETTVKAEVAFINDYDSRFAFQYQKSNHAMSYLGVMTNLYKGLYRRNIPVDVLSTDFGLSAYKLVVVPAHIVMTEDRAQKLRKYVEDGGTLVMTFRSAVKDKTGLIFNEPLPGLLQDVFGATVSEYHSPSPEEVNKVKGLTGNIENLEGDANIWLDLMELDTAEALAIYSEGFIQGSIAVTKKSFGKGTAYYIGANPSNEFACTLMEMIAEDAGVTFGIDTPDGVDASIRSSDKLEILFLVNHTEEVKQVDLPQSYVDMLSGFRMEGKIELEPFGATVLERNI